MPAAKPFTVDLKVELLELLLEHAEDWEDGDDPDMRNFWYLIQRDFKGAKGTTWQDKEFEQKMEKEEEAWLDEHEDPTMKRRRGHEQGSQYDVLMGKFHKFWDESLKRHWQFMVDEGHEMYEHLPEWVLEFVKTPKRPANVAYPRPAASSQTTSKTGEASAFSVRGKPLKRIVDDAIDRARNWGSEEVVDNIRLIYAESQHNPKLMQLLKDVLTLPPTPERNEEFSVYVRELKKKKKVEVPPPRPIPVPHQQYSQPATFRAVPVIQPNWATRPGERPSNFACPTVIAPQAIPPAQSPAQNPTPKNNQPAPSQSPSKATPASSPKSVRPAKASSSKNFKARGNFVHTSPPTDIVNPQRYRILGDLLYAPVVHQILRKAPFRSDAELEILKTILTDDPKTTTDLVALAKRLEAELQQYDSVVSERNKSNGQARAGASSDEISVSNKRRRESQSSSDAAEEKDLLEAQRAAKRRKGAGSDRDVEWDPTRRARKKARKTKRKQLGRADEEETMSDTSDEDIEQHKSAYVDEIVRKQKEEDARKVIEEQYGPVSPTDAGDGIDVDDWASMASPTLLPADLEAEDAVPTCPTTRSRARTRAPIPPPPEPGNASGEALQLISAAAADAVARDPGIARLEAKLDSLLKSMRPQAMPAPRSDGDGRRMERTATELAASCKETLSTIAAMLRSSDTKSQNPELSMAILQLTENATKSANYAARAAKRAAKMAQDVGVVLQLMVSKTAGEHPATPLSSKEE